MKLDRLPSTLCFCLLWPWTFDLISMSDAKLHMWSDFGEISSNIYEDIVFILFSGHCLVWPWPLVPKANQHCEANYICDHFGKIALTGLWDILSSACRDLDVWHLTPKANQHICEPTYICDRNCLEFPSLVCEIWCVWVIACCHHDL